MFRPRTQVGVGDVPPRLPLTLSACQGVRACPAREALAERVVLCRVRGCVAGALSARTLLANRIAAAAWPPDGRHLPAYQ